MGLDQYAYIVDKTEVDDKQVDVVVTSGSNHIGYWRNFYALHVWMQGLYMDKGGVDDDFICANVRLDLTDLEELEKLVIKGLTKSKKATYFGNSKVHKDVAQGLIKFISDARRSIDEGKAVFYDSWY